MLTLKARIMNQEAMDRVLTRIAHEIVERNGGCEQVVLVGIRRRGEPLARKIACHLETIGGCTVPVGILDIKLYQDDLSTLSSDRIPQVQKIEIPFDITNRTVILIDDVLFTGNTVHAALNALYTLGRPQRVQLAILVDRGHRELPIRADYVGKNIPTSHNEMVAVKVPEYDGETSVEIYAVD